MYVCTTRETDEGANGWEDAWGVQQQPSKQASPQQPGSPGSTGKQQRVSSSWSHNTPRTAHTATPVTKARDGPVPKPLLASRPNHTGAAPGRCDLPAVSRLFFCFPTTTDTDHTDHIQFYLHHRWMDGGRSIDIKPQMPSVSLSLYPTLHATSQSPLSTPPLCLISMDRFPISFAVVFSARSDRHSVRLSS